MVVRIAVVGVRGAGKHTWVKSTVLYDGGDFVEVKKQHDVTRKTRWAKVRAKVLKNAMLVRHGSKKMVAKKASSEEPAPLRRQSSLSRLSSSLRTSCVLRKEFKRGLSSPSLSYAAAAACDDEGSPSTVVMTPSRGEAAAAVTERCVGRLGRISNDCLVLAGTFLEPESIAALAVVCRSLRSLTEDEVIWESLCSQYNEPRLPEESLKAFAKRSRRFLTLKSFRRLQTLYPARYFQHFQSLLTVRGVAVEFIIVDADDENDMRRLGDLSYHAVVVVTSTLREKTLNSKLHRWVCKLLESNPHLDRPSVFCFVNERSMRSGPLQPEQQEEPKSEEEEQPVITAPVTKISRRFFPLATKARTFTLDLSRCDFETTSLVMHAAKDASVRQHLERNIFSDFTRRAYFG